MSKIKPMVFYGYNCMAAPVTCPDCGVVRWMSLGLLKQQMRSRAFSGRCKPCGQKFSRPATEATKMKKGGTRRILSTGYVVLSICAIARKDLPMFNAMRGPVKFVLEHRWVMAKHLGRALRRDECIDHRDGRKANNVVENLRIYLKGKNHEGSGNGYGTYYHEWQMALVRIRDLEAQLHSDGREPLRSKRIDRVSAECLPFTP